MRTTLTLGLVVIVGLAVVGCGKSDAVRLKGTVTRGGARMTSALLAIEPLEGTKGAGAIVDVKNGVFEVGTDQQLVSGKYLVRLLPPEIGSEAGAAEVAGQFTPWTTTIEIQPGQQDLAFDVPVNAKK